MQDDTAARWEMLLRHRDDAITAVRHAGFDDSDLEDCVHDAMIRLVRRARLDPLGARSLLIRASLRLAIERRRRQLRGQRAAGRLAASAFADVTTPELLAQTRADAARVLDTIAALPRREREVMLLRLAGLSVGETADELGVSYKAVEGTYTRARQRLRAMLRNTMAAILSVTRRLPLSGGEMAAGVAALVFLLHGGWHHLGDDPSARGPRPPLRAAVGSAPVAGLHPAVPPLRPDGLSGGAVARLLGRRDPLHGGPNPQSEWHHVATLARVTVPSPHGQDSPPLIYFGGDSIDIQGDPLDDPVAETEYCLLGGGFVIDEPDPLHQPGFIGCTPKPSN